jgi:hypothetical protein
LNCKIRQLTIKMNINVGINQLQVNTSPQKNKAEESDLIQNSSISTKDKSPQKWSLNNGNNSPRHQTLALGEYIYIYIYMFTYIHIFIYTHVYIHIHMVT